VRAKINSAAGFVWYPPFRSLRISDENRQPLVLSQRNRRCSQ
jgi:hypothetical protein